MSLVEEIMEKCIELGRMVARTEEYKNMKKAEYDLMHDPEARGLVEELQQLQHEQLKKQMAGIDLSPEEKRKLSESEKTAVQHPVVRASHMANAGFQDLMKEISKKIREGIKLSEE
ncbi:MAG: YlbF family regulator [Peptococcaceae bacterium]|nr:YlbF family regulator [Peptococcaceae bacterium]